MSAVGPTAASVGEVVSPISCVSFQDSRGAPLEAGASTGHTRLQLDAPATEPSEARIGQEVPPVGRPSLGGQVAVGLRDFTYPVVYSRVTYTTVPVSAVEGTGSRLSMEVYLEVRCV